MSMTARVDEIRRPQVRRGQVRRGQVRRPQLRRAPVPLAPFPMPAAAGGEHCAPVISIRRVASSGRANFEARPSCRSRRRTFFWRRMLVLAAAAVLGALAWAAAQSVLSATGMAAKSARGGGPTGAVSLASADLPVGAVPGQNGALATGLSSRDRPTSECATSRGVEPGGCQYVARPGDTIWAIAVRYSGGTDPRALEDALEAQIGGGLLQPGQVLTVP